MTPSPLRGEPAPVLTAGMTFLFAVACGLVVANIYYSQPLAGPIGTDLNIAAQATGLIVTLTQVGYVLGLLFIVPLADLFENRRLVLTLIGAAALALIGAATATGAFQFLAASLMIGICSVAVQVLVPYATHMAPPAIRGRVVGNVMSGLMAGIMMARPVASLVFDVSSWRGIFALSAIAMIAVAVVLRLRLPQRRPQTALRYGALLASMVKLALETPVLQRRAFYQALLFAGFSLFWTTTPLALAGPEFGLSQSGIALFALAGVAGAVASPIAGWMADRGWGTPATLIAILAVAAGFLLPRLAADGSSLKLGLMTASAVMIDAGCSMSLIVGQRAIYSLGPDLRARLNGLFMATFFAGGAFGSAIGGWAFAHGGLSLAAWVGLALPAIALAGSFVRHPNHP